MSDDATTAGAQITLIIPPETQEKFPQVVELIVASESMNTTERQYWIDILPSMSPDQIEQLKTILTNERDQLAAIDAKYATAIENSGTAALEETSAERHRRREELDTQESAEQSAAAERADDILKQMD